MDCIVHRVSKSWTQLRDSHFHFHFHFKACYNLLLIIILIYNQYLDGIIKSYRLMVCKLLNSTWNKVLFCHSYCKVRFQYHLSPKLGFAFAV